MSATSSDWIAFGVVVVAAGFVFARTYKSLVAGPLAEWLLRRGRVSWAMRVKHGWRIGRRPGGGCH